MARHNKGLCVIATRLAVEDIQEFIGTSARHIDLDQLSPEAGAQLLKKLGVKGTSDELKQAVNYGIAIAVKSGRISGERDFYSPVGDKEVKVRGSLERWLTNFEKARNAPAFRNPRSPVGYG